MKMKSVSLMGFMGSGKTTLGKKLSNKLGWEFIDLDAYLVEKTGKTIEDYFAQYGEQSFRELEHKCLLELVGREQVIISTGGGTPCYFNNLDILKAHTLSIYIQLPPKALFQRLIQSDQNKRPLIKGLSPDELLSFIEEKLDQREPFYKQAHITLNNLNNHPNDVLDLLNAYYDRNS